MNTISRDNKYCTDQIKRNQSLENKMDFIDQYIVDCYNSIYNNISKVANSLYWIKAGALNIALKVFTGTRVLK